LLACGILSNNFCDYLYTIVKVWTGLPKPLPTYKKLQIKQHYSSSFVKKELAGVFFCAIITHFFE